VITVGFHSDAERELNDAVSFYEALQPGLGKAFTTEVKKTVQLILAYPNAGTQVGTKLRKNPVRRFPFSLIYSHDSTQAIILAVAHHRRRPGYWKTRQP